MPRKTNKEITPNGGTYSEVFYMDDKNNIVSKEAATHAVVRECSGNGALVFETWMRVAKDNG